MEVAADDILARTVSVQRPRYQFPPGEKGVIVAAQANLEHCSVDVFLELVSYLDCLDVLRLRQVSKRMSAMSRLRVIWEPPAVKNASMLLRKRVDVCTVHELEVAVVQHHKGRTNVLSATHCIWKGAFRAELPYVGILCLAPGGRWLLSSTKGFDLGVIYIDLDDPKANWRPLIAPGYSSTVLTGWISLDGAYDGLNPSFHLALEILISERSEPGPYTTRKKRDISVWKISPTFDPNGVIDGLTAEQKFFHRLPMTRDDEDGPRTLDLQGPQLLVSNRSSCSVINWAATKIGTKDILWKTILCRGCDYARLLTERWLLVGGYRREIKMAIFDLSSVPATNVDLGSSPTPSSIPHRWAAPIVSPGAPFPPPAIVGNSVQQIVPMVQGFCLLELDFSSEASPPQVTYVDKELCHSRPGTYSYSRDTFVYHDILRRAPFIHVFDTRPSTTRGEESEDSAIEVFPIALHFLPPDPAFHVYLDAYSSRVVLYGPNRLYYICSFSP